MKKLILFIALGVMLNATVCDMRYGGNEARQIQISNCLMNEANQIALVATQIEKDKLKELKKSIRVLKNS